jgi:hypothetical protein
MTRRLGSLVSRRSSFIWGLRAKFPAADLTSQVSGTRPGAPGETDLLSFIGPRLASLWKEWPKSMEVVGLDATGNFSFRGICPYPCCNRPSVFVRIQSANAGLLRNDNRGQLFKLVAILQCQGCQKYILGIVEHVNGVNSYQYVEHYPLGAPNQTVAEEIPKHIKEDFQEALRCLWVEAYNATAEMCRRAIEASCLNLGAPKNKVLEKMIDWLEANRIITPDLKEAAHKVRLGGNRGAHPPEDGPAQQVAPPPAATGQFDIGGVVDIIEKDHAEAIVDFTRHFFQYVYVIPRQLHKYDFSKPKPGAPPKP